MKDDLKRKLFKISILILTALLLFMFYLWATDLVHTQKLYPWNKDWFDYSIRQIYASSECFYIEPNHLTFYGEEKVLISQTGFTRKCNFTEAYLSFYVDNVDYSQIDNPDNLSMRRYGNLSNKNLIGYVINASDMEPYETYWVDLRLKLKDGFYNFYNLHSEGATIGHVIIIYDNSINGYRCDDQDCFNLVEGKRERESPIWRGTSKKYVFNEKGRILIRFNPKSNFWALILKLFDTFILGSVAIIIYEILNIAVLQDMILKNKKI